MAAYGFRVYKHGSGGVVRTNDYLISPSYTTKIHTGAPVKLNAGYLELAAAGDTIVGIFNGVEYTNSVGEEKWSRYWTGEASATNIRAQVFDDPDTLFTVWDDAVGDYLTQADVGGLGDHIAGTNNDVTGVSGAMLDTNLVSSSAAGFRIIGLVPVVGNAWSTGAGTQCEVIVQIHEHLYAR